MTHDEEDNEVEKQEDVDYDVKEEIKDSKLKRKERAFGEVDTKKVVRYG